jgi:hypothetical protein
MKVKSVYLSSELAMVWSSKIMVYGYIWSRVCGYPADGWRYIDLKVLISVSGHDWCVLLTGAVEADSSIMEDNLEPDILAAFTTGKIKSEQEERYQSKAV